MPETAMPIDVEIVEDSEPTEEQPTERDFSVEDEQPEDKFTETGEDDLDAKDDSGEDDPYAAYRERFNDDPEKLYEAVSHGEKKITEQGTQISELTKKLDMIYQRVLEGKSVPGVEPEDAGEDIDPDDDFLANFGNKPIETIDQRIALMMEFPKVRDQAQEKALDAVIEANAHLKPFFDDEDFWDEVDEAMTENELSQQLDKLVSFDAVKSGDVNPEAIYRERYKLAVNEVVARRHAQMLHDGTVNARREEKSNQLRRNRAATTRPSAGGRKVVARGGDKTLQDEVFAIINAKL